MPDSRSSRLSLSHATVAVRDLDAMLDFYCDVLGFVVTNRGGVGDGSQMAFISQDPTEHHQMVFVSGLPETEHQFVMADHMAFRTGTLDDLRAIGARLDEAGVEGVIPINHGNAWSTLYDLDADPGELVNLAVQQRQPIARAAAVDALVDEMTRADDLTRPDPSARRHARPDGHARFARPRPQPDIDDGMSSDAAAD